VAAGSEVGIHYDPLLAKVITWGATRGESIERMADALRRTVVLGVVTNLDRLQVIVDHPAFRRGELHTGFIEEHLAGLERVSCPPADGLAAAALALRRKDGAQPSEPGRPVADPWQSLGAWRLG
jgi:acetyl/propionyl-CoA carboxylase alpha subunit